MTREEETRLAGARVLIVEDEYYLADDLSRVLSGAGAEIVGPVGTLDEAQAKVSEGAFDFAVVDMNLRGDFAYDVARRLGDAGVPFVVATGYNQSSLPDQFASGGEALCASGGRRPARPNAREPCLTGYC